MLTWGDCRTRWISRLYAATNSANAPRASALSFLPVLFRVFLTLLRRNVQDRAGGDQLLEHIVLLVLVKQLLALGLQFGGLLAVRLPQDVLQQRKSGVRNGRLRGVGVPVDFERLTRYCASSSTSSSKEPSMSRVLVGAGMVRVVKATVSGVERVGVVSGRGWVVCNGAVGGASSVVFRHGGLFAENRLSIAVLYFCTSTNVQNCTTVRIISCLL